MKKGVASVDSSFERMAVAEFRELGNISLVARKYKVARTTLMRWIKRYEGQELNEPIKPTTAQEAAAVRYIEKTTNATVRAIEAESATRQDFLRQHYEGVNNLFATLVNKMTNELNDKTKQPSLRDQAAALTALTNFVKEFTPNDDTHGPVNINLLQQTLNR